MLEILGVIAFMFLISLKPIHKGYDPMNPPAGVDPPTDEDIRNME